MACGGPHAERSEVGALAIGRRQARPIASAARAITIASAILALTSSPHALATSATGSTEPAGSPTIDPARQVILRLETLGGLASPGLLAMQLPTLTLYGDGTLLYLAWPEVTTSDAPVAMRATLDRSQAAALVRSALDRGAVEAPRTCGRSSGGDIPFARLTVAVEEGLRITDLKGVSDPGSVCGGLASLAAMLADIEAWLGQAGVESGTPYEPDLVRAALVTGDPERTDAQAWPWPELGISDFHPLDDLPAVRVAPISAEQARRASATPYATMGTIAVRDPGGGVHDLWLRPLLPDETPNGCPPS